MYLIKLIWTLHYTTKSPNAAPKHSVLCCSSKRQITNHFRFLQEVGYEDIFNTDEINEIKDLYDKAQKELSEGIHEATSLHSQKLEEKLQIEAQVQL